METQHSTMKFQVLFLLLLLACMYPSVAQGSYENCCLKYANVKKSIRRHVESYRVQETDGGCNIPAVVLKLKNLRVICVDPRIIWVQQMIQKMSAKNTGNM
ncbi:C-C motif chemokine 21-like [Sinocyclocheilus rhinocerous]|uniref:C-C motif chemokine 21-like n=1 Tax=Sinocyclocheilus rhinocerous TaxID=307959 RepID=A0A673N454_9TELE|nr:PREDICTED: C-C motif chemokine 21-like [Sinocyclocheilus rhinocerous]